MRQSVLEKLRVSSLMPLSVSSELPFNESGVPLYIKNPKTIYVDETQTETAPLISTMDALSINILTKSVKIYFATDAKRILPNSETIETTLYNLKNSIEFPGSISRNAAVSKTYEDDLLVTEIEYSISRLT